MTTAGICALVLSALTLAVATASAVRTALTPVAGLRPSNDRATLTLATMVLTLSFHAAITVHAVPAEHIPGPIALLVTLGSVVTGGLAAFGDHARQLPRSPASHARTER